jgi:hypothetical protein
MKLLVLKLFDHVRSNTLEMQESISTPSPSTHKPSSYMTLIQD